MRATPRQTHNGGQDKSIRRIYPEPKGDVIHAPLVFLNTPKGPLEPTHVTGGELLELFGQDALNLKSPYANHATAFIKLLLANGGGTCIVNRMVPRVNAGTPEERAPKRAGNTFYLFKSVSKTAKPYQRDAVTFKVKRDITGAPLYQEDADDINIVETAIITKYNDDVNAVTAFDVVVGGNTIGKAVPMFSVYAEAHGSDYNNYGIAITPKIGDDIDKELLKQQALGFNLKVYYNDDVFSTIAGTKNVEFALKPYTKDIRDVFPAEYGNTVDFRKPYQSYTFDETVVHDEVSVAAILKEMALAEVEGFGGNVPSWADYSQPAGTTTDEASEEYKYLVNFITNKTLGGIEYEYIRPLNLSFADTEDLKGQGVTIGTGNDKTPIRLVNGEDGDIDNLDEFERNVKDAMDLYMDRGSDRLDVAVNPDTTLYDSGFKWDTKLALAKYIGLRKDTFVALSVASFNKDNKKLDVDEYISKGAALQTALRLYIESPIYNTPTARAAVFMQTGIDKTKEWRYRLPLTLDYAIKMQKWAGALDGKINDTYAFSRQDANKVEALIDIDPAKLSDEVLDVLYDSGLVWVRNENKLEYFYPQQQTVYPDDTSVLNSITTALVLGSTARVHHKAWRAFTGATDLNDIDFIITVTKFMSDILDGKYGSAYKTIPKVIITERDKLLGFKWDSEIDLYANVAKTVNESRTVLFRSEEFNG